MKRPVAVILAIAIAGAVAFCFLRPVPGKVQFIIEDKSDTVYTFTEPQPFKLYGKDAERIEAVYERTDSFSKYPLLGLALRSADGRYYTLGSSVYVNSEEHRDPEIEHDFFTERYENGGWTACDNMEWSASGPGFFLPLGYVENAFSSTEERYFAFPLNTDKPGRYRITFYFRDYIPASSKAPRNGGSSGDSLYEASFEYDVPGHSLFSREPKVADFSMLDWTGDLRYGVVDGTYAHMSMALTNWRIGFGYLQEEGSGIMRRSESGEYVPDDTFIVGYAPRENNYLDPSDEEGDFYVRALTMNLLNWEYGAEYRLTLVFTENEDGTGEECSVTLDLRFDE